jgi:colicin import membrane protein
MHAATADRAEFTPSPPPGQWRALGLALLAHVLLLGALTWGVNWRHPPDTPVSVQAELWSAVPRSAAPRPESPPAYVPPPAARPAPKLPPRPTPPPPPAPPAPRLAQLPQPDTARRDADIALARQKKEAQARATRQALEKEQEKERKQQQRREQLQQQAAARKQAEQRERELEQKRQAQAQRAQEQKAQAAREQQQAAEAKKKLALKQAQEARRQNELALEAQIKAAQKQAAKDDKEREAQRRANLERISKLANATGSPSDKGDAPRPAGPSASYGSRVAARVKPNIVFADEIVGNPEAVVSVRASPDGTILSRKLVKSSGVKAWDEAVLKAIDKTEKLPIDTDGRVPASMEIAFHPRD